MAGNSTNSSSFTPLHLAPVVQSLSYWHRLRFISLSVWQDLESRVAPFAVQLHPYTHQATQWTNQQLVGLQPWQIALLSACSAFLLFWLANRVLEVIADVQETGKPRILHLMSVRQYCCWLTAKESMQLEFLSMLPHLCMLQV